MRRSRRGRLAAASYTGLALSVISALAVPALAHAASKSGGEDTATPHVDSAGLLPFGPPATVSVVPAAAPAPAPAPTTTSTTPPPAPPAPRGEVRALSTSVAYTAPQPGDPPDSDFDRLAQCESSSRW